MSGRESSREKQSACGGVRGGSLEGVSMLLRGASFSSTICSWFCELEALFVSNTSHTLRAARHQQQGLHHLFQTTAQCDPLHPLTTNHTVFDDVVNLLLERFLPSGSRTKVPTSPEPLLICVAKEDDNEKVGGGREEVEDRTGPAGWSRPPLPPPRRTKR